MGADGTLDNAILPVWKALRLHAGLFILTFLCSRWTRRREDRIAGVPGPPLTSLDAAVGGSSLFRKLDLDHTARRQRRENVGASPGTSAERMRGLRERERRGIRRFTIDVS